MTRKTAAKPERVNACRFIRVDVLNMQQDAFGKVIRASTKKIYLMETSETDDMTIEDLRSCWLYAKEQGIKWPWRLIREMIERQPGP